MVSANRRCKTIPASPLELNREIGRLGHCFLLTGSSGKDNDPCSRGRYEKAVASSPQRESVLRALASEMSADGEVWTTDAYKIALIGNVDNPSQYVGHLITAEYGAEIRVYDKAGNVVETREHAGEFKEW